MIETGPEIEESGKNGFYVESQPPIELSSAKSPVTSDILSTESALYKSYIITRFYA